ncbi:hypothetical protein UlMin_014574 [Ulmus minor]
MIKSALTYMNIDVLKGNYKKLSIHEKGNFMKNTTSVPMTRDEARIKLSEGNSKLLPPSVRSLEMDVSKTNNPEQLILKKKSRRRNRRKKKPYAVVENSALAQELPTFNLRGEVSNKAGVGMTIHKEDCSAGISSTSLPRLPLSCSRRKLLVLDINGLLADIVSPPPKEQKADINISRRAVFKRPSYSDFLKFCFKRFEVGIWSSRSEKIVTRLVDYLLEDMKKKLLFCWDLSHCTQSRFRTRENRHKTLVFKELRKIWEKHDPNLPWEKGEFDESNTLLLDDSPYKALLNPAYTAVFPNSYTFMQYECDNSLADGGDLRIYLEELSAAENVQKFVEQNPFGQRPISKNSATWDFYSEVLSECTPYQPQCGV